MQDSEITKDRDFDLAEFISTIPASMLRTRRTRPLRIHYDNAEEVFKQNLDNLERSTFIAPKTHYSQVTDKVFDE